MKSPDLTECSFVGITFEPKKKKLIKVFPYMAKKHVIELTEENKLENKIVKDGITFCFVPKPVFDKIWIKANIKGGPESAINLLNQYVQV